MAIPVRFGTDGIRGRASDEITVDLAYRLGRAVASVFSVPVYVGYDTRESSPPWRPRSWPVFATAGRPVSTSATSPPRGSR